MDTTRISGSGDSKAAKKDKENGMTKRRGSSKSQRSTKLSSPAANLLSPSTTSLAPPKVISPRSLSPEVRQPQPTVAVAAPEVAVSMVVAERVEGAPLGSAEALLVEGLNNAASAELSFGACFN